MTECDGAKEVALVATVASGRREIIVGMGNYVRSGAGAEIAFVVEEDFQRRGIATRLLRQLPTVRAQTGFRSSKPTFSPRTPDAQCIPE